MREAWTDDRLDDLARRVDAGFERVDTDIRELRSEMNIRFSAVDARFDGMQRTMLAMIVTLVVGFAGLITAQL